jgi:acyl carrier protein
MVIEKKYKVSVQDENVPGITAVKQAEELVKSYWHRDQV